MQVKHAVIRGGGYMLTRQLAGIALGLVGTWNLARLIGPTEYGTYATGLAMSLLVFNVAGLGLGTYLMRFGQNLAAEVEQQAFVLLILLASMAAAILWGPFAWGVSWMGRRHHAIMGFFAGGVFFQLMAIIPVSKLGRQLSFGTIARVELAGQLAFYVTALPLAWRVGMGAMAPAVGWLVQQSVICVLGYVSKPFRPQWKWDRAILRAIVSFGVAQTGAEWIWQLRALIASVVVGTIAGPQTVGIIALAQRLVDGVSLIRVTAARMAIPVIGQCRDNPEMLLGVLNKGTATQIIGNGALLFVFALVGPGLGVDVFGAKWQPMFTVFPLLAIVAIVHCIFTLHSATLYVIERSLDVGMFHLGYIVLLLIGVFAFVPHLGAIGYGYAELMALPSFVIACRSLTRQLAICPSYGWHAFLASAFAVALIWPLSPVALILLASVFVQPGTWALFADGFYALRVAK